MEGLHIALRIIRDAVFPTGKEDSDPFESDRPHGGVMPFTASPLAIVKGFGPSAVAYGTGGKFVKGLAKELRTSLAEVNAGPLAGLFATGAPHRGNAIQGGDLLG